MAAAAPALLLTIMCATAVAFGSTEEVLAASPQKRAETSASGLQLLQLSGKHDSSCQLCMRIAGSIQNLALVTEDWALQFAKVVCKTLQLQRAEVCSGAINRYGPVILTALSNRYLDAAAVCEASHICSEGQGKNGAQSRESGEYGLRRQIFEQFEEWQALHKLVHSQSTGSNGEGKAGAHIESPLKWKLADAGRGTIVDAEDAERGATGDGDVAIAHWSAEGATWKENHSQSFSSIDSKLPRNTAGGKWASGRRQKTDGGVDQGQQNGVFLQLTDFHFDPTYREGAKVHCGLPLCCQAGNGRGHSHRLGEYTCDLSEPLLDSLLEFTSAPGNLPTLDFVVYTGDVPAHTIWKDTMQSTLKVHEILHQKLKAAFAGTQVYPVLGNHDIVPADELPLPPVSNVVFQELWRLWATWLPPECSETVLYGGFYTAVHEPGLRIVALNTQWWDTMNFWLLNSTNPNADPAGQLAWLESTLKGAEAAKESVLLLGHIPPGDGSFYDRYSKRYVQLLERFQQTIAGQLFGHTHSDEFKVYTGKSGEPVGVALIAPSVTPYGHRNPSFRLFTYERAQSALPARKATLLDYCHFLLNLTLAMETNKASDWPLEYCARELYGLASLEPQEWKELAEKLSSDDRLWRLFAGNFRGQTEWECTPACRRRQVCYLLSGTFSELQRCRGGRISDFSTLLEVVLNKMNG